MISISIVFFLRLTLLSLRSRSAVSNSLYLVLPFCVILPLFVGLYLCPIAIAIFLASFPIHFLGIHSLCQFSISHSFHMTGPCQLTPRQGLLNTVLQFDLHSHFIHLLLSTLLTTSIPIIRSFSQTWTFCCFSVRAIVSNAFMYVGVTHELSTCLLRFT